MLKALLREVSLFPFKKKGNLEHFHTTFYIVWVAEGFCPQLTGYQQLNQC